MLLQTRESISGLGRGKTDLKVKKTGETSMRVQKGKLFALTPRPRSGGSTREPQVDPENPRGPFLGRVHGKEARPQSFLTPNSGQQSENCLHGLLTDPGALVHQHHASPVGLWPLL